MRFRATIIGIWAGISFLVCLPHCLQAQQWQLGIRGGPNFSFVSGWKEREAPQQIQFSGKQQGLHVGANLGLFTRIELIDLGCFFVSAQPGLQVTRKGYRQSYDGYQISGEACTERGGSGQDILNMHYLQVPAQLQFGYHLGDLTFSVGAGGFGSFLLWNTGSIDRNLGSQAQLIGRREARQRIDPEVCLHSYGYDRRPDFGVLGSFTVTYSLYGPGNILADVRYEHGLFNTQAMTGRSNTAGRKNRTIAVSIGYAYDLD